MDPRPQCLRDDPYLPVKDSSEIRALKRREDALQIGNEGFLLAVQGSNAAIWDWDIQTGEAYYSPVWKKMLGYEEYEIAGAFEEWASRVHPGDLDRIV